MLQDGIIQYQCADPSPCLATSVNGASGKSYTIAPGNNALGPGQLAQMDPLGIGPSGGALAYFHTYPVANDPNYGDAPNFTGYRFSTPTTTRDNWCIGRLDYKLSQNHTFFWRGTGVDDRNVPLLGAPFLPGRNPQYTTVDVSKGFVAGYTSLWGSHITHTGMYIGHGWFIHDTTYGHPGVQISRGHVYWSPAGEFDDQEGLGLHV